MLVLSFTQPQVFRILYAKISIIQKKNTEDSMYLSTFFFTKKKNQNLPSNSYYHS